MVKRESQVGDKVLCVEKRASSDLESRNRLIYPEPVNEDKNDTDDTTEISRDQITRAFLAILKILNLTF